jgi:hypothetical protein
LTGNFDMEYLGISLEILGMTKQEAQDYCRERGISCAFLETEAPGSGRTDGKRPVDKVVRGLPGADGRSWELLTAPFDSGIDDAEAALRPPADAEGNARTEERRLDG